MKTNKILIFLICFIFFIFFILVFLVLTTGYANGNRNQKNKGYSMGDKIAIEKRVGEADKYEYYNEIKDIKVVQNVNDILNSITWENATVSMAYPPHYKFHYEDTITKSCGAVFELWISPDEGRIELVADRAGTYVHLDKEVSGKLFKIITAKELDEVK